MNFTDNNDFNDSTFFWLNWLNKNIFVIFLTIYFLTQTNQLWIYN